MAWCWVHIGTRSGRLPVTDYEPIRDETLDPYFRMWAAYLLNAIRDIHKPVTTGGDSTQRKEIKSECLKLIMSDDEDFGSFLWVCDLLEMNPQCVRREVGKSHKRFKIGQAGYHWKDGKKPSTKKHTRMGAFA